MTTVSSSGSDPLASLLSSLGTSSAGAGSASSAGTAASGSPTSGLLSSPGIGSGLNVNSMVSQLVQAEIQPTQNQINAQQSAISAQTSAVGTLSSLLSSLQSSLTSLASGSAFTTYTATSSDTAAFGATAGATAMPGTYQIQVQQLASAQKLTSSAFASGATVGTGTLTIAVGSQSVNVTIGATNNTLAGIRDAINGVSGNPGVSATIVHATDGDHLVLTATQTGVANAVSISTSGGDGGLAPLTWNAGTGSGTLTLQSAATDAQVKVDGFTSTSSTNVVTGAIDGITLNLAGVTPSGQTDTLTVGNDVNSMQTVVQGFVTAYNSYVQGAAQLASYDASSQTAGPMLGDATLANIRSQLSMTLSNTGGSNTTGPRTLADIGITLQSDGTLQLNTGTLNSLLGSNPAQVAALFGGTSGYGTQLNSLLTSYLQPGGLIAGRNQSLNAQSQQLAQQQTQLNLRQQAIQARYLAQFTALDVTMAQMNQTSSFLTSQLSMLSSMYQPSNK